MRHQRDARLLDSIIPATLRGRDEDDVRVGSKNEFRVELPLHANLHHPAILHASEDVLVEQVLRARNATHHVVSIKHGEVRQLKRRHADGTPDGHANFYAAFRHLHLVAVHQGETVSFAQADETDVGRVAHAEACCILDVDGDDRVL